MFKKLKEKIADGVEGVSPGRQTPLRASKEEAFLPSFKYQTLRSPEPVRHNVKHLNHKRRYNSTLDNSTNSTNDNSTNDALLKSNPQEVLARVHHLLEVGRAQAQNNGKIDDTDSSPSSPKVVRSRNSTPKHSTSSQNDGRSTPVPIEPGGPAFESTPNQSFATPTLPPSSSLRHQRRTSTSSNVSVQEERSDVESDMENSRTDHLSVNELRELYRKQDKTVKRYKRKFSEVVDAYKALNKEKEKLEATLTSGQDKQLRRINELKEENGTSRDVDAKNQTIELEQEGKRHLEEVLQLNLEEKDEQIHALQTQVTLLKTKFGLTSPTSDDGTSTTGVVDGAGNLFTSSGRNNVIGNDGAVAALQDQIKELNDVISNLKKEHGRLEQEKKTAISEVMANMQNSLTEQDDLMSEVQMLRDELNKKDITILQMREEEDNMENKLRHELSKEITQDTLEEALKQQEIELKAIFEEKESAVKSTFANKVHDLQRILEENEKQKELAIQQKETDVTKTKDELLLLKEQIEQFSEKEETFKEKIKKVIAEKEDVMKQHSEALADVEKEKAKHTELLQQHEQDLKSSQDGGSEQVANVKRTMQTKIYDVQEQLRKKTQELSETTAKHKNELDLKIKEAQQQMQSDHAKASRKLEVKVSDMKKMIKELRTKLNEKDSKCQELETSMSDIQNEANQSKVYQETAGALNASLAEAEEREQSLSVKLVEQDKEFSEQLSILKGELALANTKIENFTAEIEIKNNEILEWRSSYEELNKKCEVTQNDLNTLTDEIKQKLVVEEELNESVRDRESSLERLKQSESDLTTEISNLKNLIEQKDIALLDLNSDISAKENVITELKNKENELEGQVELLKSSSSDSQKEQAERFENEIENIRHDYQQQEDGIRNEFMSQIESYKKKQEELSQTIETLTNDLNTKENNNKTLQEELKNAQAILPNLSCSSFQELQLKYENIVEELNEKKSLLETNTSQGQERQLELQQMIENLKLEVDSKSTGIENLKQQLEANFNEKEQLTQQLNHKSSELEVVTRSVENANNELSLKEEEFQRVLVNKSDDVKNLNEKYTILKDEKEFSENNLSTKISQLEENHRQQLNEIDEQHHVQLQLKDEEWRSGLNQVMNDKNSSVESLNAKLEDLRKQEIDELETRYTNKIELLNNDWNERMKNIEEKYKEEQNKIESEYTKKESEKDEAIHKITQDLEFFKNNQKELNDTQEAELLNLTTENERLKTSLKETSDIHLAQIESLKIRENELVEKHSEQIQLQRTSMKSEIDSLTQNLKLRENELIEEHSEEIQRISSECTSMKSEIDLINENQTNERNKFNNEIQRYTTEIEQYKAEIDELKTNLEKSKSEIDMFDKRRGEDLNELNKSYEDDRNLLLKQIDEVNYNMNELKKLCDEKDTQLHSSAEKYEIKVNELNEQLKTNENETLEKLGALENLWKEKQQNLEKKFKKIISERDKKYKKNLEEKQSKHQQVIEKSQTDIDAINNQLNDKEEAINTLRKEIVELTTKLTESNTSFDAELSLYKTREQDAWQQLDETKQELVSTKENNEKQIAGLESQLVESKSRVEELQLKVMSGESSSKEVDTKLTELLNEKNELQRNITEQEHAFEEQIRNLQNEKDVLKQHNDETVRALTDEHLEKIKSIEKDIESENKLKSSENDELHKTKLLEMKKKAETKIAKLKKDFSEKTSQMEAEINELKENITSLKTERDEEKLLYEKQSNELKDSYDKTLNETLNASQEQQGDIQVKLTKLQEEIQILSTQVKERDEKIDNMTVDKMDALKAQKIDIQEEYEVEMKKVKDEAQQSIDVVEKKLQAKVDERDFDYNCKIKQMIKDFQQQLSAKDREVQVATQDAIEIAQKDERKLIAEYNEQITELERELRLREKDMVEYQTNTEQTINQLQAEKDQLLVAQQAELNQLENDYNQRMEELMKQNEEVLLNASQSNTSAQDVDDLEQSYESKIRLLEEQHQSELKKQKLQLKKTKNEMRKLLAEKGVQLVNGDEIEMSSSSPNNSNPGSDIEADPAEVQKLKSQLSSLTKELKSLREREKVLAMQAERSPVGSTPNNDRPATLHLDDSFNNSNNSSPKTPQPLEYEYLRNILFNYMMGKQRKQMAKVLTAIVNFPPNQVKQILAKVEEQETVTNATNMKKEICDVLYEKGASQDVDVKKQEKGTSQDVDVKNQDRKSGSWL